MYKKLCKDKCIYKSNVYKCSEHRFCVATKPTAYAEREKSSPITPTRKLEKK